MLKLLFSFLYLIYIPILVFSQDINSQLLQRCWHFPLETYNSNLIASDNTTGLVFIPSNNSITVLNSDGKLFWKTEILNENIEGLWIFQERIFVLSFSEKDSKYYTRTISFQTGLVKSIFEVNINRFEKIISSFQINDRLFLLLNNGVLKELKIESDDISEVDSKRMQNIAEKVYLVQDFDIYFLTAQSKIVRFNIQNNTEELMEFNIKESIDKIFSFGDSIILTSQSGKIYTFDKAKLSFKWLYQTGAGISNIVQFENKIFVFSNDNFIYCFSLFDGDIKWKYKSLGRVDGVVDQINQKIIVSNLNEFLTVVLDFEGKLKYQLSITDDENNFFINKPIIFSSKYFLLTRSGLYSYTTTDCK